MSPPTSLKYTMPTNGMRWHASAKTILPSRAQDGKVMEAFERLRIAKRAERQDELVKIVDQAIDMAITLAGYRRTFGSLPDGWFEKGDDGKPVVGCNEYLFVFAEKVAEQTRLGRALRRLTGVNTTFVDLFLAVVYGRLRCLQHRKDNGLVSIRIFSS